MDKSDILPIVKLRKDTEALAVGSFYHLRNIVFQVGYKTARKSMEHLQIRLLCGQDKG